MNVFDEITPAVQHFDAEFDEFDALAESVEGWDLDWQQLDRGRLEARVQQLMSPSVHLSRVDFSRKYHQRGATPPGFLTFGLLRSGLEELNWCGLRASVDNLLVFRPGGEYESLSPPGFGGYTLSFSEELLNLTTQRLGLPEDRSPWSGGSQVLSCDPDCVSVLRSQLRKIFEMARTALAPTAIPAYREQIEVTLASHLLKALAAGQETNLELTSVVRFKAARKAVDQILEQPREALIVRDLCEAAAVSERTLRYAFRELYGVTPKQFLQAVRLNGVRGDLRNSRSGTRVAEVANRWGFWHMGQLAADYRKHFGELPSETLRTR